MPPSSINDLLPTESVIVDIAVLRDLYGYYSPRDSRQMTLEFYVEHPCSVMMTFGDSTVWELSRDMLLHSLSEPQGEIHVFAACVGRTCYMLFHTNQGDFAFEMATNDLRTFLASTDRHIPIGTESGFLGLDAALDLILKET